MAWRLAKGLEKLREQVNEKWPGRSKESDGSVGDTSHSARKSDHNPDVHGVVHAIDITHDPKYGFDSYKFADMILAKQDPRLSYVISNRRIGSGPGGPSPGKWRPYAGVNPHDHHVHISITAAKADDVTPWAIDNVVVKPQPTAATVHPILKRTVKSPQVLELKMLLKGKGVVVSLAGSDLFDNETYLGVMLFQLRNGLVDDGVVGSQTWKKLTST